MKTKKTKPLPIKYPNLRCSTGKTPADELRICETCRTGRWCVTGLGREGVRLCQKCRARMRLATPTEKSTALEYVIAQGGNIDSRQEDWKPEE
jgi:hypothetical protein